MEASEVRRLASLGFTRAPGESDDELRMRARWRLLEHPRVGYGTSAWWARRTLAASWWVRHVRVSYRPMEGVVTLRVRGPLGLPLPGWVKLRVEAELVPDAPINVRVVVL